MNDLDVMPVVVRPTVNDPDVEHFVCCYHTHVTYCGLTDPRDCTGWADDDEIDCVVCLDLSAAADDAAGGLFCPVEPHCRFATNEGPDIP